MKAFSLLCLILFGIHTVDATHLRGGYIQARSISTAALTYEVTVRLFLDEVQGTAATAGLDRLSLCFGDGRTQSIVRTSRVWMSDKTISINTYIITHTFAGPGTYTLTTALLTRSTTRNITGTADQFPLVLYTTLSTNGSNQTPTLVIPETGFQAATNQRLVFPLTTTDAESDSLVYSLTRPRTTAQNDNCSRQLVESYQYPNDVARQGTFTLANRTGIITWDTPVEQGNYSLAITVSEYRNGIQISQSLIEVSLVVVDRPGIPGIIPPYEPALEGNGPVTGLTSYPDNATQLTVFPNPVDDRLQVVVQSRNSVPATIRLRDVNGRLLHELTFKRPARRHEQMISLDSLTPGTYLVQVDIDGQSLVEKVVKNK